MLTWISENAATLYVFLGLMALGPFALLWAGAQRQDKRRVLQGGIGLAGVALLAVGVALLEGTVEPDTKKIEKAIAEMGEGVKANQLDRTFEHISRDFRYGGTDKAKFRQVAGEARRSGQVTEVVFWDVDFSEGPQEGPARTVKFKVKARGNWGTDVPLLCRAQFVREADGAWRLKGFQVFNSVVDTKTPISLPYLGNP